MIALACSTPPEGRVSWTLQLPADGLVEREIVERISPDTVGRTLKKTSLSRAGRPQASAQFVCAMEDVLEVYHRDYGEPLDGPSC